MVRASLAVLVIADLPFNATPGSAEGPRRPVQGHACLWIVAKADLRATPPGGSVPYRALTLPMMAGHIAIDYENEIGSRDGGDHGTADAGGAVDHHQI